MKITKISRKQRQIFKFTKTDSYALICDGSVRSGKTVMMVMAFVLWAMENFTETSFAICGKTVQSVERNVLRPLMQIDGLEAALEMRYKSGGHVLTIRCGPKKNDFYLFGGKDEASYTLIQGITLAGVMFDEVALMPRSFVDQAIARTITYENAKLFFNCNPGPPKHWFYLEWIKTKKPRSQHLHFQLEDNPILSREQIERTKAQWTGVFYDRYILGLWVAAEGVIHKQFAENPKKFAISKKDAKELVQYARYITVGVDFGGNKSAHAFVGEAITWDRRVIVLKSERMPAEGVTTEQMTKQFKAFCQTIEKDYAAIDTVWADCAEQAIINSMNANTKWDIRGSIKGEIIDRIRAEDIMLSSGRLQYVDGECDSWVEAMSDAVWDPGSLEDVRLDDGTSDIDTLDAFEYGWCWDIKDLIT